MLNYVPYAINNERISEVFKNVRKVYNIPDSNPVRKVKVAVIDSGYNFADITNYYGVQTDGGQDWNGHGTHVTGIILATNPFIEVSVYQGVKSQTYKNNFIPVTQSLSKAIAWGADIINISLSGTGFYKKEYKLLKKAESLGIIVVVSAGNDRKNLSKNNCDVYPACYQLKNVIVVGNLANDNIINSSSNYGDRVDTYFYGTNIFSTLPNNNFGYMTGTSMSAPFITGLISIEMGKYKQKLTISKVRDLVNIKSKHLFTNQAKLWNTEDSHRSISSVDSKLAMYENYKLFKSLKALNR